MTYRVDFTTAAARQIKKLPRHARDKVLDAITALADEPRPRKLAGEDTAWRIRVGDYRIIYEIVDNQLTVTILRAAHRREAYER